jgi:hypothetical protein
MAGGDEPVCAGGIHRDRRLRKLSGPPVGTDLQNIHFRFLGSGATS